MARLLHVFLVGGLFAVGLVVVGGQPPRVAFAIDRPGWNELTVVAANAQGVRSSPGRYRVYPFSSPVVSSDV